MNRSLRTITLLLGLTVTTTRLMRAQERGALTGVVTAAAGGAPLVGARVASGQPVRVTVTDASGHYALKDLPVGTLDITVSAIGHTARRQSVTITAGSTTHNVQLTKGSLMLSSVWDWPEAESFPV